MIFNSVTYLVFLTCVCLLYWTLPQRGRLWLLFAASILFYGFWRFDMVPVMLLSAAIDFQAAGWIYRTTSTAARRIALAISLTANLGLLAFFKYSQFAIDTTWGIGSWLGWTDTPPVLQIILPLGISFYTFQTISYTIDVYRGHARPVRDWLLYGCYVVYFPQLVAGPILRVDEVCPQLLQRPALRLEDIVVGIRRILAGLFLKVVLADNVAGFVNEGFQVSPSALSALDVWTLAFLFGFQIYFDFSAYSHIAIGSARVMGIRFPENFCFPYIAVSPRDFWGRWHISLSSWIRDYLYLPLCGIRPHGGSQGGLGRAAEPTSEHRRSTALFATWAIMGLWHGAGFNFLAWGLYHAMAVFLFRRSESLRQRLPTGLRYWGGWAVTLPTMMLSWIFFRADSLHHAGQMLARTADLHAYGHLGMRENTYLVAAIVLPLVLAAGWYGPRLRELLDQRPVVGTVSYGFVYTIMIAALVLFLRPVEQFIYFQF